MSARMSSVGANLAAVLTKLIDPLSPPTPTETFVPRSWSAFDRSSPFRVFVPSLNIAAARLPTPRRSAASNWSAPPRKRDRERDERQVVLFRHDQLGAVRELRFRPCRHAQLGNLSDRRLFGAVEGLGLARSGEDGQTEQRASRARERCGGSLDFCAFCRLRRLIGLAHRHDAQHDAAGRQVFVGDALHVCRCHRQRLLIFSRGNIPGRRGWRRHSRAGMPCRDSTRARGRRKAPRRPSPSALLRRSALRA